MKFPRRRFLHFAAGAAVFPAVSRFAWAQTGATEINVLSNLAVKPVLFDLIPEFERQSGSKVQLTYGTGGATKDKIIQGEAADVVINTLPALRELEKLGRVSGNTIVEISSVGLGVAVRRSAPKPDIASPEAFYQSLLNARAVALTNPAGGGGAGIYMAALLQRLGMTEAMKPKIKLVLNSEFLPKALQAGDADFGIAQISEIAAAIEIELVGPLPPQIQNTTRHAVAVTANSSQPIASKLFIQFLLSPTAKAVFKAKGLEPS
jgi:molybdate transport system substrate-binding protein